MELHQSGNKIIVTELNPMCDAPRDSSSLLIVKKDDEIGSYPELMESFFDGQFWNCVGDEYLDDELIGWLPMPVYDPAHKQQDDFKLGHERYEKLRELNAQQFSELYQRNLAGENFDEMVDKL